MRYGPLARFYDGLTGDVPYEDFADYYRNAFASDGGEFRLLLDLCCGTGTLTVLLAEAGYEMIGADASPDMLSVARQKAEEAGVNPLFLCQSAEELDLYGTVDAAVSSLDSFNYLEPEALPEVLHRLFLFIRPGGILIFDVKTLDLLKSADKQTYIDEDDSVFCVWRADWSEEDRCLIYGMDIFEKKNTLWSRNKEEHVEYAYTEEQLKTVLSSNFFRLILIESDTALGGQGRQFYTAQRTNFSTTSATEKY